MFRSHFVVSYPRPKKYAEVISSKASNSTLDERGDIHFELCLQKSRAESERAGKVKQCGDVIWTGGILHNRIFSCVGHHGE